MDQNIQNSEVESDISIDQLSPHNFSPSTQLQVPLVASQLDLKPKKQKYKPTVKQILLLCAVAIIAIAIGSLGLLVYKNMNGYGVGKFTTDGVSYSVYYNKNAKQETIDGKTYLLGKDTVADTVMLLAVGKSSLHFDCAASNRIKIIDRPEIEGTQHNLCYSETNNTYTMNFVHIDQWYSLTLLPKDHDDRLADATAQAVASSVKIR